MYAQPNCLLSNAHLFAWLKLKGCFVVAHIDTGIYALESCLGRRGFRVAIARCDHLAALLLQTFQLCLVSLDPGVESLQPEIESLQPEVESLQRLAQTHYSFLLEMTLPDSVDPDSADLGSADLGSADPGSADPGSVDLDSADLDSADLDSADLDSADLDSADPAGSASLRQASG